MTKCTGCGIELESDKTLCERCFRIIHYNEYTTVVKNNDDFIPILKTINESKDLVVLVVDLFLLGNISFFRKYLSHDILLVLTKRDLFPKRLFEERLLNYDYGIDSIDTILISSSKNYHFDELLEKIKRYQHSKNVYVVGYTNAGKSTMINRLLSDYSNNTASITTSPLPSTTLNQIEVSLDDTLTLLDTPGLLEEGNLLNLVSGEELKKIVPRKEIKPITYQVKNKQIFIIDKYARIEVENMNLTFYVSNQLSLKRYYKEIDIFKEYTKHVIPVNYNDIVINGLGFIKCSGKGNITIYTLDDVKVYTRKSLI